jgi:hypothetical protein
LQQQQDYLATISTAMKTRAADGTSNYLFPNDSPEDDAFQIGGQNAKLEWRSGYLVIAAPGSADDRTVWMRQTHGSQLTLYAHAREIDVRVEPNVDPRSTTGPAADRFNVNVELFNVELETQNGVKTPRGSFARSFSVPMSAAIRAINTKRLVAFLGDPVIEPGTGPGSIDHWQVPYDWFYRLHHDQIRANNAARSELHGRASFALSCLSLVLVGCALGVMFRSGHFLNAFACSFVPALLCMTLIISGQQMATHVPFTLGAAFKDPLPTALMFIWSGNVAVLIAAIYLTLRLQRR